MKAITSSELSTVPATPVKYTDRPRPKVFLPIPAYDWKTEVHFQASVMAAQHGCHADLKLQWNLGDGIARTRNNLAWHFLRETDCEYIFFVDSDIVFSPVQLDRVVSHGLPICGGLYPKKQGSLSWVVSGLPGEAVAPKTELLKVRETGTGFLCIRRDVLEKMIEAYPDIIYHGDPGQGTTRYDFFPMHAKGGRYLSEDWFFCNRAREIGYDVCVDTSVQVEHVGKIIYPLQKTLTDNELIDIVAYRTPHAVPTIRAFLGADVRTDLRRGVESLWPDEFLQRGISPLHCDDVLAGCYDVSDSAMGGAPVSILDIGANIGAFARWSYGRWPSAKVTCFEPDPENFDLLNRTIDLIGARDRTTARQLAVVHTTITTQTATLRMRKGRNNCGENSLHDIGEQTGEFFDVPFVCANELPAADFLKLDTEGCEYDILSTLAALCRLRDFRTIVLEYHREGDRESIRRVLQPTHELIGATCGRPNRGILKFVRKANVL